MTGEQREFKNEKKTKFVTKIHQEPGFNQMVKTFHNCLMFNFMIYLHTDQMKKREGKEAQLGRSNILTSDQLSTPFPLFPP